MRSVGHGVRGAFLLAALLALGCTGTSSGTMSASGGGGSYTLTLNKVGGAPSGTVTSNPAGLSCGTGCTSANHAFDVATVVTLSAAAAGGSSFTGWNGGGCSGTGTCTVTMSANRTVTATFAGTGPYTLTVTKTGQGTVTSAPAGISCGADCSEPYAAGTDVTLTAVGENGYTFAGWSGSGIVCPGTGTCTVTMSAARTVLARFTSGDTGDLCDGLVKDKANHPKQALSKPAVGQAYTDPSFGTTIRRITDAVAAGASSHIVPAYSTIQAWNADESYLVLYWVGGEHHLYDGRTYAHIKLLDINPPEPEQFYWDLTDPRFIYYVSGRTLYRYNVDTDATTTVQGFTSVCSTSMTGGVDPMWTSWGPQQIFGFVCGQVHFAYNLATATIGSTATVSSGGNHPAPGPSGQYFFLNLDDSGAQVRDASMTLLGTLSGISSQEHASLGSSDGDDTLFSVQWGTYEGTVVASNLVTRQSRVIVGPDTDWPAPPSGTHLSAISYDKPGWLAVSVVGATSGATTLNQEVLLVNANTGGAVCRVGHHRSTAQDYWAEPHVSISPSGTRMIFASDWGTGNARVDTYVIELPGYQP